MSLSTHAIVSQLESVRNFIGRPYIIIGPFLVKPIPYLFPVPEPDQKDLLEEDPDRYRYLIDVVRTD